MQALAKKRALVTGAGRRVGAMIAEALGAEGMHVGVHYHGSQAGAQATCETVKRAGGEATAFRADLYQRDEARALVGAVLDALGGLDLLVASAANFDRVAVDAIEDRHWDRALDLNLTSPFLLAHGFRDALRTSGGSIVFVTCTSRLRPYRDYLPYAVSKAGVHQLMRLLALELAPEVRVNAVAPGTVLPPPEMTPEEIARARAGIPLGRLGDPADVARAVVYLAQADWVTGEELLVDGGHTLNG